MGLTLPPAIEFEFLPIGESCRHATVRPADDVPLVTICRPPGASTQALTIRITLLHELAHTWHWAQGDGSAWPDWSAIVGGSLATDESLPWVDRMEERVATVISWGLLDQLRRPVRRSLPCAELYEQFVALTGHEPLGPLEPICLASASPDPSPTAGTG